MTLAASLLLVLPLVIAGILHMLVVKLDLLPRLRAPIHERAFGRNKTYRGFVVMPVAATLGVLVARALEQTTFAVDGAGLQRASPWLLGSCLGLAYVLGELPNSLVKRRLHIAPGKLPAQHRVWFLAADHLDSATACLLVYAWLLHTPWLALLAVLVLGALCHFLVNLTLYALGIRAEPV